MCAGDVLIRYGDRPRGRRGNEDTKHDILRAGTFLQRNSCPVGCHHRPASCPETQLRLAIGGFKQLTEQLIPLGSKCARGRGVKWQRASCQPETGPCRNGREGAASERPPALSTHGPGGPVVPCPPVRPSLGPSKSLSHQQRSPLLPAWPSGVCKCSYHINALMEQHPFFKKTVTTSLEYNGSAGSSLSRQGPCMAEGAIPRGCQSRAA